MVRDVLVFDPDFFTKYNEPSRVGIDPVSRYGLVFDPGCIKRWLVFGFFTKYDEPSRLC